MIWIKLAVVVFAALNAYFAYKTDESVDRIGHGVVAGLLSLLAWWL